MIDQSGNVLKTFTDYEEETDIQFVRLRVSPGHPWIGKSIRELTLTPDTLLAVIQRGDQVVVPRGTTVIEENDLLILAVRGFKGVASVRLKEIPITVSHRWCGLKISEVPFKKNTIIIMVRRGSQSLIPTGSTRLLAGDTAVVYSQMKPAG